MKKIIVSECLYGGRAVRHDGGMKTLGHPLFLKWKEEGRLIPVCPEILGGLPVPRAETQLRDGRAFDREGRDLTECFALGAERTLALAKKHGAALAILKENSPSCGSGFIYDGTFSGAKIPGSGITAKLLEENGIRVFSETEMDAAEKYCDAVSSYNI